MGRSKENCVKMPRKQNLKESRVQSKAQRRSWRKGCANMQNAGGPSGPRWLQQARDSLRLEMEAQRSDGETHVKVKMLFRTQMDRSKNDTVSSSTCWVTAK